MDWCLDDDDDGNWRCIALIGFKRRTRCFDKEQVRDGIDRTFPGDVIGKLDGW